MGCVAMNIFYILSSQDTSTRVFARSHKWIKNDNHQRLTVEKHAAE